jgi:hypothetical protein
VVSKVSDAMGIDGMAIYRDRLTNGYSAIVRHRLPVYCDCCHELGVYRDEGDYDYYLPDVGVCGKCSVTNDSIFAARQCGLITVEGTLTPYFRNAWKLYKTYRLRLADERARALA